MTHSIRVGISPCPNDTFAFHALLEQRIATPGLELEFVLADVEELNQRFERGELDASKASFAAMLRWSDRCLVLSAGSALGFGVGPLLLARHGAARGDQGRIPSGARVLVPGERTTAHLLYRLFHAGEGRVEQARFSDILPALERGEADFGVCIHEGRFVWRDRGLECLEDLGATWEARTQAPLPLGGIAASLALERDVARRLDRAIRDSIAYAGEHRDDAVATMRKHAQELSIDVIWQHVDLYVNPWTRDLGIEGRRAIETLAELARSSGWTRGATRTLEILGPQSP